MVPFDSNTVLELLELCTFLANILYTYILFSVITTAGILAMRVTNAHYGL